MNARELYEWLSKNTGSEDEVILEVLSDGNTIGLYRDEVLSTRREPKLSGPGHVVIISGEPA